MAGNNDDTILSSLIIQAREYCEEYQRRKYITQELELYLDRFPVGGVIEFRDCSPIQSVKSITCTDINGAEVIVPAADYVLDNVSFINKIVLAYGKSWPSVALKPVNGIKVSFMAGFGDATAVPETVKWAMVLHMKLLYDDYSPDERRQLEAARDSLLSMNRVIPV